MLHKHVFTLMRRVVGQGPSTQAFTFILHVAGEATFALTIVGQTTFTSAMFVL